jgi:hypothetical protein
MKYLLDTDRVSILQRQAGIDFSNLRQEAIERAKALIVAV